MKGIQWLVRLTKKLGSLIPNATEWLWASFAEWINQRDRVGEGTELLGPCQEQCSWNFLGAFLPVNLVESWPCCTDSGALLHVWWMCVYLGISLWTYVSLYLEREREGERWEYWGGCWGWQWDSVTWNSRYSDWMFHPEIITFSHCLKKNDTGIGRRKKMFIIYYLLLFIISKMLKDTYNARG